MKLELSIPDKLIPSFLRADRKALEKFQGELDLLKSENVNQKLKNPKRVAINLTRRRNYIASMKQDELKLAVEMARMVERPRRDILYTMYDEVWDNDGHTIGETRKAILKVVGSPFGVFPVGSDQVDEVSTRLLQRKWFEDYRKYFQQASFFGHSLVQLAEWKPSTEKGMHWEVKKVDLIDRYHVRPEEGYVVMDVSHETGIPFRDEKFAKGLMLIEMGDPRYLGLLRLATKEFIWKNYARSDWSRHSEKFGMPMLAIKTSSTNKEELDKLQDMAESFGNNLWAILDQEDEIDLKEPTFKDSYQIYKELVLICNSEVSKAISGATGTSDEKAFVGGAEVHERILNEFVEANKRAETYHINEELFPILTEQGYPFEGKEFRYLEYQTTVDENKEPEPKGKGGSPAKKDQGNTSSRALFT